MTPDIKAIREAAESVRFKAWGMDYVKGANPATVIALCDEVESLREQIFAYQSHERQLLAAKMGLECEVERLRKDAAAYHAIMSELDGQMRAKP